MKKSRVMAMILTGVVCVSLIAGGCNLVQVDPEKDKKVTIAEIEGTPVLKESLNNYLAYYQMYYDASGMAFPTEVQLKELKESILDDLVQTETFMAKGIKDEVTVDETSIEENVSNTMETMKTSLGDDKYADALEKYHTDEESFKAFLDRIFLSSTYVETMLTSHLETLKENPDEELGIVTGTVGGEDIKKDVYNFRLIMQELNTYYQTGQALQRDEETMKTTNKDIFDIIAGQKVLTKYAEEKGLEADQAKIDEASRSQETFIDALLPDDESKTSYLDQKLLTIDRFNEFLKEEVTVTALEEVIRADVEGSVEVSYRDIQRYYNNNKDSYSTSTVSAKHILAGDEAQAKEVYEDVKDAKTAEEFDAFVEKYKTTEGIQEASDLGEFDHKTMVKEFSDAAFGMDVDTVSKPVQTQYGYHVIYVYGKNEEEAPSLDDKKEEITEILKDQKTTEAFDKIIKDGIKAMKIKINDIIDPNEAYLEEMKEELNVKVYKNRIY